MDFSKKNLNQIINNGNNVQLEFDECKISGIEFEPIGDTERTIIGIPGGPGIQKEFMLPLIKLQDKKSKVVLFEPHNVGESEKHSEPYKIETHRNFIDKVVRNYENVVLAGHSWGSMIAMDYVCKINQSNIEGLILLAPLFDTQMNIQIAKTIRATSMGPKDTKYMNKIESNRIFREDEKYEALAREIDDKFGFIPPVPSFVEDIYGGINGKMYEEMWGPEEFVLNKDGELSDWSVLNHLSDIDIPTLLLTGEYDIFGYHDMYEAADKISGNSTVKVLNSASHSLLWERPGATNSIICDWIDKKNYKF